MTLSSKAVSDTALCRGIAIVALWTSDVTFRAAVRVLPSEHPARIVREGLYEQHLGRLAALPRFGVLPLDARRHDRRVITGMAGAALCALFLLSRAIL
jgi:hypothetical protein